MVSEEYNINGKKLVLDRFLRMKLDNVKKILTKQWDCLFLIDGIEGSGKSTLGFICAWYISDGKITMNNICEGTEDAINKLDSLAKGSVLIVDEGSLVFSSKDAMRREYKRIEKILNVIRQKCMCLIIISPSFFNISKYVSSERSRFLLHVYTDRNLTRGRFTYFGEKKKKMLYSIGKRNFNSYAKPKSDWIGSFGKFELPFHEDYLEHKQKTITTALKDRDRKIFTLPEKRSIMQPILLKIMNKLPINSQRDLAKCLDLTEQTLSGYKKPMLEP